MAGLKWEVGSNSDRQSGEPAERAGRRQCRPSGEHQFWAQGDVKKSRDQMKVKRKSGLQGKVIHQEGK